MGCGKLPWHGKMGARRSGVQGVCSQASGAVARTESQFRNAMKLRDRVNGARLFGLAILSTLVVAACVSLAGAHQPVHIHVTSRETGETLPARLYVRQLETGVHFFVESLSPEGTAVPYDVARSPTSFERHTTVSAHPCRVQLPAGSYVLIVERGPEYHSHQTTFEVGDQPLQLEVPLQALDRHGGARLVLRRHSCASLAGRTPERDARRKTSTSRCRSHTGSATPTRRRRRVTRPSPRPCSPS